MRAASSPSQTLAGPRASAATVDVSSGQQLGDLARGRMKNAKIRLVGAVLVAAPASLIAEAWGPALWALGFAFILIAEHEVHRRLASACEAETPPSSVIAPLIWTSLQSAYANMIAIWLWFAPYKHTETAAVFFLIAGLANAAASLRADTRFMIAGVIPTLACLIGLPITQFALGGFSQWLDLSPLLAAILFLSFGYTIWRELKASDAALLEAQLSALREQEAKAWANDARAQTLAQVQNELRTPMAALGGAVEQIKRANNDGEPIAALTQAKAALSAAVKGLSNIGAFDHDARTTMLAPCDVRDLARGVAGAFRAQAEARGLELFLDIDPETPDLVEVDAERLRQVLSNLIANAVAFTRHGGVRVRVQARPGDVAGQIRLGFCVADTGAGMSRSQLAQLFEGEIDADRAGGGIAIARRSAALMRARLNVKSDLGEGTMASVIVDAPILSAQAGAEAGRQERAFG